MAKETKTQNVQEELNKADVFFKENKKTIWGCVAGVIILAAAVFCYVKFVHEPGVAQAKDQMWQAESSFRAENYELALDGDGNALGFADVISQYGSKAPASAWAYAGISALQLGRYEDALGFLKAYRGGDEILSARVDGCIGDCYAGLDDFAKAFAAYRKAAGRADNLFTGDYLFKAGLAAEKMENWDDALSCYREIREKYPRSIPAYDIEKYISRIENR